MNIALVTDTFPQATETFVVRHAQGLSATVFAPKINNRLLEAVHPRVCVRGVDECPESKNDLAARVLRRIKQSLVGIPEPAWPARVQHDFDTFLNDEKPDVVLAEFGPNGICAIEACKSRNIPLVVHFHGSDTSSYMRIRTYREALPRLFQEASAVICVSQWQKQRLLSMGCQTEKLHVIPCGAPVDLFQMNPHVDRQPCHFIAVASFLPIKGPFYTLSAFAECRRRLPEVRLTMIGGGKLLPKAQKWVRRHGLCDAVTLTGPIPNDQVRSHLAASSVFLQHSHTSRIGGVEGWPVSMAEAAACGMPIVATNHGGIPDQVMDGVNGYLVEERDWQAMAVKMALLAQDPAMRKAFGLAARNHVVACGNTTTSLNLLRQLLTDAAMRKTSMLGSDQHIAQVG